MTFGHRDSRKGVNPAGNRLVTLTSRICLTLPIGLIVLLACAAPLRAVEIEECRKMWRAGEYEQCLQATRKAIEEGSYGHEWPMLMVRSLMTLGRYAEAAEQIEPVVRRYSMSVRVKALAYDVFRQNGRPDQAQRMLEQVNDLAGSFPANFWDADDLVALGQVAIEMGHDAKIVLDGFYDRAKKLDPNCRAAYQASGDLALKKQDYDLASKFFMDGLKKFPDDPDLHAGLAYAYFPSNRGKAGESVEAALLLNPNHTPSLLLRAEHEIDSEDPEAAMDTLQQIHQINPHHPDAWAFKAVLAHLRSDDVAERAAREAGLAPWRSNPRVDHLIGRKLSQRYRFAEAAHYQRMALAADSDYLPAKIQLAQDLLRLGEETEGWSLADQVSQQDAYNVLAYNLVTLHETLRKYRTINTENFIIRMAQHEADVYGDRVVDLLEEARTALCEKYDLRLDQPTVVEIFADQRDFAVRTFGMPGGAGYLGVCFGDVITANSPAAQTGSTSNWEAVLWHEFCHVVTLNMTRNKMPRWLSEGISVYEELQRNPTWGQRMNPDYRRMVLDGELTPVGDLSSAFMSPPSSQHLMFAYFQSNMVVEFIVERYGHDSLKAILTDLGIGKPINDAIATHTAPIEQIEEDFEAFARAKAEALGAGLDWSEPQEDQIDPRDPDSLDSYLREHPNSYWGLNMQAGRLMQQHKWDQVKATLKKLIELYPQQTGGDSAYMMLAAVHRELGETEDERLALEALASRDGEAAAAYARLMEIAVEVGDWDAVRVNAERFLAVNPLLARPHQMLARAAEASGDAPAAIGAYRRLLNLNPEDPADVHFRLARLLTDSDRAQAKRHVLAALEEAPRFRDAHRLLLSLLDEPASTPLPPAPAPVAPSPIPESEPAP